MLTIENLYFSFQKEHYILNNISFSLSSNGIIGLIGKNGEGKSTFLKILAGILVPDKGKIFWKDIPFFEKWENLVPVKVGYLSENFTPFEYMRVFEYVKFFENLCGGKSEYLIKKLKLEEVFYKKINKLSKGYKQRLGIFQSLCGNKELVLLDEPLNGLDPSQKEDLFKLLIEYKKNKLIIISSHLLEEISELCDEFLLIKHGKIEKINKTETIEKAEKAFLIICHKKLDDVMKKVSNTIANLEIEKKIAENRWRVSVNSEKVARLMEILKNEGVKIEKIEFSIQTLKDRIK